MALVNLARDLLADAITGGGIYTLFNTANAHLGVGDTATAFSAAHTDLQAPTNKLRKVMDGGYPQRAANVVTWRTTFGLSEANFAWEEFAIFNAAAAGQMLARFLSSEGTKPGTQSWELTVSQTFVLV